MIYTGQHLCLVLGGACVADASTTGSWWSLLGSVLALAIQLAIAAWARRRPQRPW
jgi:hypothetical protein